MTRPLILTTTEEIQALANRLAKKSVVAIDLEADSMHSYQEKVCLLQVSTDSETLLIDPLAGPSLEPLRPILAKPGIRKIFHAADYDLRCLRRDFGMDVNGLFDTMVSAQLLGEERIGLADMLKKHFSVELDKRFQRADWSQRPLSDEMVHYAAEDTRHLHHLAERLEHELRERGRWDWAVEEFLLLEQVRFTETEGPLSARFKGANKLDRRQLGVLEELLQWRNQEAQRGDRPPFKVIGNASLLALAGSTPQTMRGLVATEGVSPRHAERHGRALLKAIRRGQDLSEQELPIIPRKPRRERDPQAAEQLGALKTWRQEKARSLAIDPGVLINNALLEEIARQRPQHLDQLGEIDGMKQWQLKAFGNELLS